MPVDLIVCVATELEGALLRAHLAVLCTGVGSVNAACSLTRFLEREGARAVIVCGIGGAYPNSNLEQGTAVWAESECYGDLGANSAAGFLDMRAIGFPVIAGPEPVYNTLPLQIAAPGPRVPFITVNACTGDDVAARAMVQRTGGCVENMEGAAIAHVAAIYGLPCGEVRGISNRVGNRDRGAWRVKEAAVAAQQALLAFQETCMNGIIRVGGRQPMTQTVRKLEELLAAKGIRLFAVIDHSGEAEKAGLKMPPTKLLIFGNPAAGTPLMLAAPSIAIDLPLKILVAEDVEGRVWLSYNSPAYLRERHGLPAELLRSIAVIEKLVESAAE